MPANTEPWIDWIPGALARSQVRELFEAKLLTTTCTPDIGASSVDLTLSEEVFFFPDGAVKPSATNYHSQIKASASKMTVTNGSVILEPHKTYLVKLNERIELLKNSPIYGQATAKSSVGRIDVLARLIVDGMNCYEYFDPKKIGNGDLYLEITSLTF